MYVSSPASKLDPDCDARIVAVVQDGRCTSLVHTQQTFYDSGTLYFTASTYVLDFVHPLNRSISIRSTFFGVAALLSTVFIYSQTVSSPLSSFTRTMLGHRVVSPFTSLYPILEPTTFQKHLVAIMSCKWSALRLDIIPSTNLPQWSTCFACWRP